ncbi:MAG TPA: trehalose-phosphatase [Polyangiaceae bacterium]|jgi:trehalose 6-phosphate phosphatase|nr:trehalose-phosphatase [Polyangiaceae bacterium]
MKYLLSSRNVGVLAQVAWSRVLLAFDFDGTLAPIVADRASASMRQRTSQLLARTCALYPCAVISGRSQADVAARLSGAAVKYVVGNHGLEPGTELAHFADETARAAPLLRAALLAFAGVEVEDKRYSLTVHYRRSRRKGEARAAIRAAVAGLPIRMRVILGKQVVNVVSEGAPSKGDALLKLRTQAEADTALYVGDDVTDEDVFVLDQPGRLLTVRIGLSRSSAAAYFLRRQREIDALLAELSAMRKKGPAGR